MFNDRKGDPVGPVMMPAGEYYIGDPCYVIADQDWMTYLDTWPAHPNPHIGWVDGAARYKNMTCFQAGTAYGDGEYKDNKGRKYGVDAGMLGIVPLALCEPTKKEMRELGRVAKFDKPFRVYRDEDYTFYFGEYTIPTNDE